MSEPTYRQTLSHTWSLVWHHKILWIFGLLSVLLGQFGLDNFLGQMVTLGSGKKVLTGLSGLSFAPFFRGEAAVWSVWLIFILAAIFILVVTVSVVAEGALIASAGSWFKVKKSPNLTKAWHVGAKHFWPLLVLNVLKKIIFLVLLFLVCVAAKYAATMGSNYYETFLSFIFSVGIFLALVVSATTIYAAGFIVVEREDFVTGLRRGWKLLQGHFLVSLELSLMFLAFDALLVTLIVLGAVWFFIPSFVFTIAAGVTGFTGLIYVGLILSKILFLVGLALLGAIHNAFITSAWIYLFMKMHREGLVSRLLHLFRK